MFRVRGKLEILATAAGHAFLPFYASDESLLRVQVKEAFPVYERAFGIHPCGFWPPHLGWVDALGDVLIESELTYSLLSAQSAFLGDPPASCGAFYPAKTATGLFLLPRDYPAGRLLSRGRDGFPKDSVNRRLSLKPECLYLNRDRELYNPAAAKENAWKRAREFLEFEEKRLAKASAIMGKSAISLCLIDENCTNGSWFELPDFLAGLFVQGLEYDIRFGTPLEYLCHEAPEDFETIAPEYGWGVGNGFDASWLDEKNNWIFRHIYCSQERMVELSERFDGTGLCARALNQAAREILLAQSSDWPAMLSSHVKEAGERFESHIRNFNTIYDYLGGGHISTKWLTYIEQQAPIFPDIDFRNFRRDNK
jgi:1,4-alpha-glucan branching enzyme